MHYSVGDDVEVNEINYSNHFGDVMGLVAAWARSFNFVACKMLFENKSTNSTELIVLFAGFGGFSVSLVSSLFYQKSCA